MPRGKKGKPDEYDYFDEETGEPIDGRALRHMLTSPEDTNNAVVNTIFAGPKYLDGHPDTPISGHHMLVDGSLSDEAAVKKAEQDIRKNFGDGIIPAEVTVTRGNKRRPGGER